MSGCPEVLYKNFSKDLVDAFGIDGHGLARLDIRGADTPVLAYGISAARALLKKWEPTTPDSKLREVAIQGFLSANEHCAKWSPSIENPLYQTVLDEMALTASQELPELTWYKIFWSARHGPGASVLSQGKNSSFEKLFLNRLSTTSVGLYEAYLRCCRVHPTHLAAELRRREIRGQHAVRLVEGSTLSTVRKNDSTDRTICTEASLNMFWQLGLGEILNETLAKHYGYCPRRQPERNRRHACAGSLGKGRSTIDLRSASDTIATAFVQHVMRSDWFAVISDLRAEKTKVDGRYVTLSMVSSMGNGFTFPLQTYLFSLAIKCLCKVLGVQWRRYDDPRTSFGVFGDDIIVPDSLFDTSIRLLSSLGFMPNEDKSFGSGPFRESCGADYFLGHNVRGVYIRKLSSREDAFSAVNRLNLWSARSGIPCRRTIRYLLPKGWKSYVVPTYEADDAGIKTPRPLKSLLRYTCREPIVDYVRVVTRHGHLRRWADNLFGYVLSCVDGTIRSGQFSRRKREVAYQDVVKDNALVWASSRDFEGHGVTLSDWEALLYANLELA